MRPPLFIYSLGFSWNLLALLAGFRKADGDGLLRVGDLLAAASALQLALMHFVHLGLDLLAGGGAVLLLCGLLRCRLLCWGLLRWPSLLETFCLLLSWWMTFWLRTSLLPFWLPLGETSRESLRAGARTSLHQGWRRLRTNDVPGDEQADGERDVEHVAVCGARGCHCARRRR